MQTGDWFEMIRQGKMSERSRSRGGLGRMSRMNKCMWDEEVKRWRGEGVIRWRREKVKRWRYSKDVVTESQQYNQYTNQVVKRERDSKTWKPLRREKKIRWLCNQSEWWVLVLGRRRVGFTKSVTLHWTHGVKEWTLTIHCVKSDRFSLRFLGVCQWLFLSLSLWFECSAPDHTKKYYR